MVYTYVWLFLMAKYGFHVGKYTIHGLYGKDSLTLKSTNQIRTKNKNKGDKAIRKKEMVSC